MKRMTEALKTSEEGRQRLQEADGRMNYELAKRVESEIEGGAVPGGRGDVEMGDLSSKRERDEVELGGYVCVCGWGWVGGACG